MRVWWKISYYGRLVNTLALLDSPGKQQMDAGEGFGCQPATVVDNRLVPETIAGGGSRRVTTGLLSGLLHQSKWLPLAYLGGLTFELELGALTDWCSPSYTVSGTTTTLSQNWQVVDARLECDVATIDSGLQSQYANHVLQGKHLPAVHIKFCYTNAGQRRCPELLHGRANPRLHPRLKGVFCTAVADLSTQDPLLRGQTTFYHPMGPGNWNSALDTVKYTLQLGSRKRYPDYHVSSVSERSFYEASA